MFVVVNPGIYLIKRKHSLGFKYIRFKSSQTSLQKIVPKEIASLRIKKLSELLDCSNYTAKELVSRNQNILALDYEQFIINATFCSKHLRLSEIIEFPCLMTLESSLLQHRYFSLKELGCSNLSAYNILRFPHIIKQTPKVLAKSNIHFNFKHELFDHFMSFLPNSDSIHQNELKCRLEKMFQDGSNIWKIKETMNAEFLASKLNCSLTKAHQLFHRYPPMRLQSISNTSNLIDLLFQQLNFPISRILQLPRVLSIHYETAECVLNKFPEVLGINTSELTKKFPPILSMPTDTIQQLEEILRKFNISDKQLLICPKILSFTPKILEDRLEYLCSSEDFELLKSYKKFLFLVCHYATLHTRLEALKALDLPRSINVFVATNQSFQRYLACCKSRANVDDVCHYLAEFFMVDSSEVMLQLRQFPNTHNACLGNTSQIVHFLLAAGVSKQQIYNGLGIILYDFSVVKEYFQELRRSPACQPFKFWVSHYNLIQLLIYTIEADYGFKASRSYKVGSKCLDSEDFISSYA